MLNLPRKLDGLLCHGDMLPKGGGDEIPLIKQDIEKMIAILQDHDNSRADEPPLMVKCWMKEVRELSYDMEDCIDQYQHATHSRSMISRRKITRRKSKTTWLPKKLKQRLWMANKIREFSVRSQEALRRYSLFNLGGISTGSTRFGVSFGSWHPTSYEECANHPVVGIDAPMNKLEEWLIKDGEQNLKVISVVGLGGVGKTTLVNKLYHKIGGRFECRAFVRMSRKPDMRKFLISMLSQVRPHQPAHSWKVHTLIADIRAHLQDKRYLIIIDDVWATSNWDIVNCALPDGNHCGRTLITTEIEDVALKCCAYDPKYVFMMKPLDANDSSILFFNTAFGRQHVCPPDLFEVSKSIIRKCGGLPLAIVTIASLLASRMHKPEQLDYVNKFLGYDLRTNPTLEGMKQVLNLSYNNLPQHLKACMLYVSMYQEDYIIWKDDLVKQWIAEGLICATEEKDKEEEEKDKEEISRNYFDELISCRMIQPGHISYNDEVLSCTVHHMVLNFITHKSIEENFVIKVDHSQTTTRFTDKVRRLSLQFGNAEDATSPTNMRLSQVRTLVFFGVFKCVPSIVEFRLLQVLVLHFWGDDESISLDLTRLSELFRLRYLQVTSNVTLELQRIQMRGLQYLETMKIDARVSAVPPGIVHLPRLLHLNLHAETNLPNGIGHMTSLRALGYFNLSGNSIENVQSLGELTNLQDLQLTCHTVQPDNLKHNMQCLVSILWKLSNLKSLILVPVGSSYVNSSPDVGGATSMSISGEGLSSISSPPALLQKLELLPLICIFSNLPKWIGHLGHLCILKIGVSDLASNDVDVLRGLPALTILSLYVHKRPAERIVFNKAGFSVVKYFKFRCSVPLLKFEADAMPKLQNLKLGFNAPGVDQCGAACISIEHLSGLKEISVKIGGAGADAESALTTTVSNHPSNPVINVQLVDSIFYGHESTRTLEQQDEITGKDQDECYGTQDKNENGISRGLWTVDEDRKLVNCISTYGMSNWNSLPQRAGLKRTGKSCRSHWLNYLRPDIKRGEFSDHEHLIILDLHSRYGNSWSRIAQHLPGRTGNEIENYWRTGVQKHATQPKPDPEQSSSFKSPSITDEAVSGHMAGGHVMSAASSKSEVIHDSVSGSMAGFRFVSQTATESQVTYATVSGGAAGVQTAHNVEVDSTTNSSMGDVPNNYWRSVVPQPGLEQSSAFKYPAMSDSEVTDEAVGEHLAGDRFMSAAASSKSEVTHEALSGSVAGLHSMSPAASESQVTYETVSGGIAGVQSAQNVEVESTTNNFQPEMYKELPS